MKLVVRIPSSHEAERRYSVDVLLGAFLGLDYRIEIGGEDYRIELGGRRLVIRDRFFGAVGADYLAARNLPVAKELAHPLRAGETIVSLYGDDELVIDGAELRCGIDLFAATFFMLTRWEEIVATNRDPHGRCLARDATTERWLDRCLVNEWTELLWGLLQKLGCTQPRREHTFAVVASHDIDYPRHWSLRTGVVTFGGDLIKRRSPIRAVRTARAFVAARMGLALDPYDTFDWLMDRSDEEGITSNFNFMTGRWSEHDPPFDFEPRALGRLLARVAKRGHGIGFHPSYNAYNDPRLWKLEHDRLAQLSPQPVIGGREHYLRFAVPETWRIWNANGMEWDSTLGYADREGFRCGTCYEFPVFDVHARRQLRLHERPLVAMDATLVGYRKLDPAAAAVSLAKLRAECKKYGGTFMLLWHNSNLDGTWLPYRDVYRDALRA